LFQYLLYPIYNELQHGVGVDVLILSEKGLNPSQTFSYADEIISMFFLIAVKGLDKVFGTSLSFTITSNQLENGKEVLLNVEIQIRLKIAESYW
jgi:hypothetical protein